MDIICLKSEDLHEIPDTVLKSKCQKLNLDFNDIVTIPSEFCENLRNMTFLSINGNMVEILPVNIGLLTKLTELYLKENNLVEFPESFAQLKHLQKLHVTGNKLRTLPAKLHLLESLTELVADENNFESFPDTFGELKSLSHLSLSYNAIEYLPDNFGNLKNLKELDLSNNCLKSLPESFQYLPSLEVLDLTNNKIYSLPLRFQSSKTLRKLLTSQNEISSIPAWFSELENIKEIHLSDNYLNEMPFPDNFGDGCSNLELIDLSGNNITGLPESFGKLKKLSILDLGSSFEELERNWRLSNGNDVEYLPVTFCDLKSLTKLELDENQIFELPENFGLLENLIYLDLSHNILKYLPESFGQLKQLKVCLLSMNYITHLPASFGTLKFIEDLKLDNNMIEHLPDSFENLTSLTSLDLYNNNLKEPPFAVNKLKCLKHLDLRENDFGRTLEDLLAISYEPTYPVRNPELQNDWRGKKRADIQPSSWVEKKDAVQTSENFEKDFLYNAMISASALWRRHGQADRRSKILHSSIPITNGLTENAFENPPLAKEEECWDDDMTSQSSDFKNTYRHPINDESSEVDNSFVPSDLHVERVGFPEVWHLVEDGQFDDDDDELS